MEIEKQLIDIEKKLWTNDARFYKDNLIEEALLAFAETGVITKGVAVDAILTENAEGRNGARFGSMKYVACGLQRMPLY